jgi:hypothetical protein
MDRTVWGSFVEPCGLLTLTIKHFLCVLHSIDVIKLEFASFEGFFAARVTGDVERVRVIILWRAGYYVARHCSLAGHWTGDWAVGLATGCCVAWRCSLAGQWTGDWAVGLALRLAIGLLD